MKKIILLLLASISFNAFALISITGENYRGDISFKTKNHVKILEDLTTTYIPSIFRLGFGKMTIANDLTHEVKEGRITGVNGSSLNSQAVVLSDTYHHDIRDLRELIGFLKKSPKAKKVKISFTYFADFQGRLNLSKDMMAIELNGDIFACSDSILEREFRNPGPIGTTGGSTRVSKYFATCLFF